MYVVNYLVENVGKDERVRNKNFYMPTESINIKYFAAGEQSIERCGDHFCPICES